MKTTSLSAAIELRRRAEARLFKQRAELGGEKAQIDALRMVQELEVFKIELELQTRELEVAKDELARALKKHKELYDLVPAGYISLNEIGDIMEVNLAGAALLGKERSRLIGRRLLLLIAPTSWPGFSAFLKKAFRSSKSQRCEAALLKQGGATLWAGFRTASPISDHGTHERRLFTFQDITDRKLAALLTPRELEVLRRIVAGEPNKYIAAHLGISRRTVEKHRVHLMEKLKVHDVAGLTRYALSAGIIGVTPR